jgi:hypothetical protein
MIIASGFWNAKISSTVPRPNFPVNGGHSEGDSVKSASPKSSFPNVDEDIGIFSWNVISLRRSNDKEFLKARIFIGAAIVSIKIP